MFNLIAFTYPRGVALSSGNSGMQLMCQLMSTSLCRLTSWLISRQLAVQLAVQLAAEVAALAQNIEEFTTIRNSNPKTFSSVSRPRVQILHGTLMLRSLDPFARRVSARAAVKPAVQLKRTLSTPRAACQVRGLLSTLLWSQNSRSGARNKISRPGPFTAQRQKVAKIRVCNGPGNHGLSPGRWRGC